jgi:ADP-ribose pyrophosphatase YjhB (NUDIX family)
MKAAARATSPPDRRYPQGPVVGVGAVVVIDRGVVLVRRSQAPLAGRWSLPGGRVELGETARRAVRREIEEETGLKVVVGPLLAVVDRIHRDRSGRVAYHYVVADYLCRRRGGTLRAGSDASAIVVARASEFDAYHLSGVTRRVAREGLALARRMHR